MYLEGSHYFAMGLKFDVLHVYIDNHSTINNTNVANMYANRHPIQHCMMTSYKMPMYRQAISQFAVIVCVYGPLALHCIAT